MKSKEYILNKIEENTKEIFEKPNLEDIAVTVFENPIEKFKESLAEVGGEVYEVVEGKTLDLSHVIKMFFPNATTIATHLSEVTCANINPNEVDKPQELNGVDVAIIKGNLGVAENAAIWFVQDVRHRIIYFIPEALIVLLSKKNIVSTMHHAYAKIDEKETPGYGVFISGPSKTADIEQALVMGAHGARRVLVILQ